VKQSDDPKLGCLDQNSKLAKVVFWLWLQTHLRKYMIAVNLDTKQKERC